MSAAPIVEAALAFLEGDVFATVNAAGGALVAGSVVAARAPGRRAARRDKPHALSVEVVFVGRGEEREGLSSDRVTVELDLRIVLRAKDASEGKAQAATVEAVARALVRRYRGATALAISVAGATFRAADARVLEVDEEPASGEVARGVVRLALVFSEPLAKEV